MNRASPPLILMLAMTDANRWTDILTEHRDWLRTVIRARLFDPHASEDLLQDVAIAVLAQDNRPTEQEHIAPWLYRITLRKIINYQRFQGRQENLLRRYGQLRQHAEADDGNPGEALHWLVQREQAAELQAALARLSQTDREMLMLKYTHQWSYAQIASSLGVSQKTIEYRLLRARKSLRAELTHISGEACHD